MNFTSFVGSTWKRYKNFPIDGANASAVKNGRFLLFAQNIILSIKFKALVHFYINSMFEVV